MMMSFNYKFKKLWFKKLNNEGQIFSEFLTDSCIQMTTLYKSSIVSFAPALPCWCIICPICPLLYMQTDYLSHPSLSLSLSFKVHF